MKSFRIIDDSQREKKIIFITEEGAKIIWGAYEKLFGKNCQTMERREDRGGICHLSEIDYFKKETALHKDFNYKDYETTDLTSPIKENKQ